LQVQKIRKMSKVCQITGKKVMSGNNVSHSHKKTRRKFYPNLQKKKFFLEEENRWIQLKVSTEGIRLINKVGLQEALNRAVKNGYLKKY